MPASRRFRALGIIPARGGSKAVQRKNLQVIAGEPLLAYAIRAASESTLLHRFVTSTDDKEVAVLAQHYGCAVIARPPELARDDTPVVSAMLHALEHAERDLGSPYEVVVLLQPTAPIRTGSDVDAAIELLRLRPEAQSVVSVCRVEDTHPARMYRLDRHAQLESLWSEWEASQRQDLPPVYIRNGALYAVRRDALVSTRTVMAKPMLAYVMPLAHHANIDDERDVVVADSLVRLWKEGRL